MDKKLYAIIEGAKYEVEVCNFFKGIIIVIGKDMSYEYDMSDVDDLLLE